MNNRYKKAVEIMNEFQPDMRKDKLENDMVLITKFMKEFNFNTLEIQLMRTSSEDYKTHYLNVTEAEPIAMLLAFGLKQDQYVNIKEYPVYVSSVGYDPDKNICVLKVIYCKNALEEAMLLDMLKK